MSNYYESPTVTNCSFSENSALRGGGIYNYDCNLTVIDCTFSQNTVVWDGGGIGSHEPDGGLFRRGALTILFSNLGDSAVLK